MVFKISHQAVEVTLLVSFAAFTVCCAGFFDQKNETGLADGPSDTLESISSTYPLVVHSMSHGTLVVSYCVHV